MARPRSNPELMSNLEGGDWGNVAPETSLEADRTRFADKRPYAPRSKGHNGELYFPPELVPHGWKYAYVVETVLNTPQRSNIQKAYANGWRFVPQSDHPELVIPDFDDQYSDGRMRAGGQVLMKKPLEDWEADQEYYAEEDRRIKQQSSHLTDYLGQSPDRFKVENDGGYSPMRTRTRT